MVGHGWQRMDGETFKVWSAFENCTAAFYGCKYRYMFRIGGI